MSDWKKICTFADVGKCQVIPSPPEVRFPPVVVFLFIIVQMAKVTSIQGKAVGKVGAVVYAVSGGQQIAREYQPHVANPSTEGQVNNRSRFKLLSQLSASLKPVIAIRKEGLVSARNQFQSINYGATSFDGETAKINLNVVQLTKSNASFVGFNATRAGGSAIVVKLNAAAPALDRVVFAAYEKRADGTLLMLDSVVTEEAGADNKFQTNLAYSAGSVVVYAYGIRDLDAAMSAKFGNLNAPTAENVAKLIVSSTENAAGVSLTQTAALTMNVGTNTGDSDDNLIPSGQVTVTLQSSVGNSTETGAGTYDAGESVTINTTTSGGGAMRFDGWYEVVGGTETLVSENQQHTFTATRNITLRAVWVNQD